MAYLHLGTVSMDRQAVSDLIFELSNTLALRHGPVEITFELDEAHGVGVDVLWISGQPAEATHFKRKSNQ